MNLYQWAIKWNIPFSAIRDLQNKLGMMSECIDNVNTNETESEIQTAERLKATVNGGRLWRNNVGAVKTNTGSFVRFGLANTSKQMNEHMKSSDLIGIQPIVVGEHNVGQTIGIFTAREIKKSGWVYSGTNREVAQLNFIQLVNSMGGDACFVSSIDKT